MVSRAASGAVRVVQIVRIVVHNQVRMTVHFLKILWSIIIYRFVYVMHMVSWLNQIIRVSAVPNEMGSWDAATGFAPYRGGIACGELTGNSATNIAPGIPLATLPSRTSCACRTWLSFVPGFAAAQIMPVCILSTLQFHGHRAYLRAAAALTRYARQLFDPRTLSLPISFVSFRTSTCHVTSYFIRSEVLTP